MRMCTVVYMYFIECNACLVIVHLALVWLAQMGENEAFTAAIIKGLCMHVKPRVIYSFSIIIRLPNNFLRNLIFLGADKILWR